MFGKEPMLYQDCGLSNIFLINGFTMVEHSGEYVMEVEDRFGLHREIAVWLVTRRRTFDGREIKFIRRVMDLSQAELGHQLKVGEQTVARWEKGKVRIPAPEAQLLRLTLLLAILKPVEFARAVEAMPAHLADGNEGPEPVARFKHSNRWKEAVALLAA